MSLEHQVYYCEVPIARAERIGNDDAVRRLTEYETSLASSFADHGTRITIRIRAYGARYYKCRIVLTGLLKVGLTLNL